MPVDTAVHAPPALTPTDEQRAIVEAAKRRGSFAVQAYAGSGKTTTLHLVGNALGERKALYLAFNTDVVRKAKTVVGPMTTVATAHGFARRTVMARYGVKIDDQTPAIERRIRGRLHLPDRRGDVSDPREMLAARVADAFAAFLFGQATRIEPGEDAEAAEHARAVWDDVYEARHVNERDHDIYVKLFQVLQDEAGHPSLGFDAILYDECQDCTGAMLATVNEQRGVQRIYVGDPHQAIYAFRGATNAFEQLDHLPLWPLTTSFRFGPKIASLAQLLLRAATPTPPIRTVLGKRDTVVATHDRCPDPDVILTRTQSSIIEAASKELARDRKVAVVGTLHQSRLKSLGELADGIHALRVGKPVAHPRLQRFSSFETLKWFADKNNAQDLRAAVGLVERYGADTRGELSTLEARLVPQEEADVIVSTAHAFKGREGARVRVADDFRPFATLAAADGNEPRNATIDGQELNLAYVTVTRASDVLDITSMQAALTLSLQRTLGAHVGLGHIVERQPGASPSGANGNGNGGVHAKGPMRTGLRNAVVPKAPPKPAGPILITPVSASDRAEKAILAAAHRLEEKHNATTSRALQSDRPHVEGTLLETLVSNTTGAAFVHDASENTIWVAPIDASASRTAALIRNKRVRISRKADGQPWDLRVVG